MAYPVTLDILDDLEPGWRYRGARQFFLIMLTSVAPEWR